MGRKLPGNPNLEGHFCTLQTGPWEGRGSWLYKIQCVPCKFEDFASCYDDAVAVREIHAAQAKPIPPKEAVTLDLEDDEVWEEL